MVKLRKHAVKHARMTYHICWKEHGAACLSLLKTHCYLPCKYAAKKIQKAAVAFRLQHAMVVYTLPRLEAEHN